MKKLLAPVAAGAAIFTIGSKWIKSRRRRGLTDPVTTVKITANKAKDRIRQSRQTDEDAPETAPTDSEDADNTTTSDQEDT